MENITPNTEEKKPEQANPVVPVGIAQVSLSDFQKLDIRVGKIIEAVEHPQADKLLLVKVDMGGKTLQVVAGIRMYYKCADLIGRLILIIVNLKPATLRGQLSEGMILACKDSQGLRLIVPDGSVEIGSKIS